MSKKKNKTGLWSAEEIKLLKRFFPSNANSFIAQRLFRSVEAVRSKAARLGLRKSMRYLNALRLKGRWA